MKIILVLALCLGINGCVFHVEPNVGSLCGYDNLPYYEEPQEYDPYLECGTWYTVGHYFECAETWCYNQYLCGWEVYDDVCYPI